MNRLPTPPILRQQGGRMQLALTRQQCFAGYLRPEHSLDTVPDRIPASRTGADY